MNATATLAVELLKADVKAIFSDGARIPIRLGHFEQDLRNPITNTWPPFEYDGKDFPESTRRPREVVAEAQRLPETQALIETSVVLPSPASTAVPSESDDLSDFGTAVDPVAPPSTPKLLNYALACIRRGWYVFPCLPRSKAPATEHGFKDSSNDEAEVRAWWEKNPNYNPAIDLGRSNLVVRDFDTIRPTPEWPSTFTVRTGRVPVNGIEGIQLYYVGSCKTRGVEGGEVRSRGAYVMAPGAIHPSGNPYTVVSNVALAPSPEQNQLAVATSGPALGTDEQMTIAEYVEGAFDVSGINYRPRVEYQGGFMWHIVCPWEPEHEQKKDPGTDTSSSVIMWQSGKLIYECKHAHCLGIHQWITPDDEPEKKMGLRRWMENKVGHFLVFGEPRSSGVFTTINGVRVEVGSPEFMEHYMASQPSVVAAAPIVTASPAAPASLPELVPAGTAIPKTETEVLNYLCTSTPKNSAMPDSLGEDAYYGIAGRHLRSVETNSEAHPAGILALFLAGVSSIIGTSAYRRVEDTIHYPALNVIITGNSSRSRKNTAINRALHPLKKADIVWGTTCIKGSFSSGEGLASYFHNLSEKGQRIRLFLTDTEFKTTLTICGREGNTLSESLRRMFDFDPLESNVKKTKHCIFVPLTCGASAGLITKAELLDTLKAGEIESGFVNRYMAFLIHRVRHISRGKKTDKTSASAQKTVADLKEVFEWLESHQNDIIQGEEILGLPMSWDDEVGEVKSGEGAGGLWDQFYNGLDDDDPEYLTRAEVFVLRLTMVYTILDKSNIMRLPHLKAALAVWKYARQSGEILFGGSQKNPDIYRLLDRARTTGKLSRGEVSDFFSRNKSADAIEWIMREVVQASDGELMLLEKDYRGESKAVGIVKAGPQAIPKKATG